MYDFQLDSIEAEDNSDKFSKIKEYFKGKTVLLTNAAGSLGLLYVEKLLRSDVKQIYVVVDGQDDITDRNRLKYFTGTVFSIIRNLDKDYLNRIKPILGDKSKPNLGINETDLKSIYDNVNIVLHPDADIQFDKKLIDLVLTDLRETQEILKISEKIKKLEVFTYVSSAYSNCSKNEIEEKFYDSPVNPEHLISYFEKADEIEKDKLDVLSDVITKPWPNTSIYSKCLSEDLVKKYSDKFPVVVIRPSLIISTYQDPITGWTKDLNGLTGIVYAMGLGVLRVLKCRTDMVSDIVCADYVINSTMAAIWYTHEEQLKLKQKFGKQLVVDPEVYYVGTSTSLPIKWGEITSEMTQLCKKHPATDSVWKVGTTITPCSFLYYYYSIMFHFIPSLICDWYLSKTSSNLRIQPITRKVQHFINNFKFFMENEFKFSNKNMTKVLKAMTPNDAEFYPSDPTVFERNTFWYNYLLGVKRYIAKENPIILTQSKKHSIFALLHIFVLGAYYGLYLVVSWLVLKKAISSSSCPLNYYI